MASQPALDILYSDPRLQIRLAPADILDPARPKYDLAYYVKLARELEAAGAHVLGIKDGKKRFADVALAMSKAFTLCCTLDEAKEVREEVAFLQGVKVILTKKDLTAQKKTDEQREHAIRQIINSEIGRAHV